MYLVNNFNFCVSNTYKQTYVAVAYNTTWNLGPPTYTCQYCSAILWHEERTNKSKKPKHSKFSICYLEGRVQLPLLSEPPAYLKFLLGQESGKLGMNFRKISGYITPCLRSRVWESELTNQ